MNSNNSTGEKYYKIAQLYYTQGCSTYDYWIHKAVANGSDDAQQFIKKRKIEKEIEFEGFGCGAFIAAILLSPIYFFIIWIAYVSNSYFLLIFTLVLYVLFFVRWGFYPFIRNLYWHNKSV